MNTPSLKRPRSLMIATPIMDGLLDYRHVAALIGSTELLRRQNIRYTIAYEVGNSLIADARNRLVARFLAEDWDDLLFIDADIAWQPESLLRLLAWDVPFVAASYPRKSATPRFAIEFGPTITRVGELFVASRVGTGFMRLRRDALQRLAAAHPELRLRDSNNPPNPHYIALFDTGVHGGQYVGEDFLFCDRWRALGGQVLVDADIPLQHIGTRVWEGRLADFLQPNRGAAT